MARYARFVGRRIACFFILRGFVSIAKLSHQINEEIRDKEVRLIGADGEQLGVVSLRDALAAAAGRDLDLVKIAPKAEPPVCRIMDYGKFRFEQTKKEKEARKNQHIVEVKEIRLSPGIDIHDFDFKLKNAKKFLEEGNKLKVSIRFRGRAIAHSQLGEQTMLRFAEALIELAVTDKAPKLEGRSMLMFMSPKLQKPELKKKQTDSAASAQDDE